MAGVAFIIEDDMAMADCLELSARAAGIEQVYRFEEVIGAAQATNEVVPDVILLDVLLSGPNGFTLLNELASYSDTARVPVILISSLNFQGQDLRHYNIIKILDKTTMLPADVMAAIKSAQELVNAEWPQNQSHRAKAH